MSETRPPTAVWVSAGFFALAGVLEVVLAVVDGPRPLRFVFMWEAVGRGLLDGLVAYGLWHRMALCRTVAMVYCLAAVVTYLAAVGLALFGAPLTYPTSVIVQSLYQVPSCLLLFPFLRSPRAAELFVRPLIPR
jgi:hypothetical protein